MKSKLIIILLLLTLTTQIFAQKETYNWYFGAGAGITFMPDGEKAEVLTECMIINHMEGTATLSDRNGNLLFYSDGENVWNKNHKLLLQGSGLRGHFSSARSAIIIPKPGSNQYYYVFTIDALEEWSENNGNPIGRYGVNYSMIDILLDNGNGDIMNNTKNVRLLDNAVEKMIAINHANKEDIWLVVYNWKDNYYYTYLITKDGISEPIKTARPFSSFYQPNGTIAFGGFNLEYDFKHNKLIDCDMPIHSFVIYNFNTTSGTIQINNPVVIPAYPIYYDEDEDSLKYRDSGKYNPYSAVISDDGSKLYGSCRGRAIIQWDLLAGDIDAIIKSRSIVSEDTNNTGGDILYNFGAIRKGPDNKMYIARSWAPYLAIINEPNEDASNCGYESEGVYLEGNASRYGLPIMMNYNVEPCVFTGYAGGNKNICIGSSVRLGGNFDTTDFTFLWTPSTFLDDPNILNPTCNASQQMTYILMIVDNIRGCIDYDTIFVDILPRPSIIKADNVTTCKDDPVMIGTTNNDINYVYSWSPTTYLETPNGRTTLCTPDQDMTYILTILDTTTGCYNYDTINVSVRNLDNFELVGAFFICEGKNTTISVKDDFASYYWSTDENTKSIIIDAIGEYYVIVTDEDGCSGKRTFEVVYLESDNFNIIAPETICAGIETTLRTNLDFPKYKWSNGDTTPTITINKAGIYYVDVENGEGCYATDTVFIDEITIDYSFPDEIIFPTICNDTFSITNAFVNNSELDIYVRSISLKSGSNFNLGNTIMPVPLIIKQNGQHSITTNFSGMITGNYTDTLIISLYEPCDADIIIPLSANVGGANTMLITNPIRTEPSKNIIIPVIIRGEGVEATNNSIKCSYRRDMVQVYGTNIGEMKDITRNELIETISIINLFSANNSGTNEIDLQLYATTTLGLDTTSDIIFFDFESDIPCANIDSVFVNFELIGCRLGERIFKFFEPTTLSVNATDNYFDCEISSEEEGAFSISIYSLLGEQIQQITWFKKNKLLEKKNILLYNYVLGSGSYFILLQTPSDFIRKKVLKIKQ
ncbi:MAG: hypothetical protein FWG85_03570 [Bacteroidetes bacterium]|nr:hypothetical protein [Bacteroidota bacterium]